MLFISFIADFMCIL